MEKICIDCDKKEAAPGRTICYACRSQRYKDRHPFRYAFLKLRNNAKRRKKDFLLSFNEFKSFCIETDYIDMKGRMRDCLHIDRIDNDGPYSIDNIQVLTCSENCAKGTKYIW